MPKHYGNGARTKDTVKVHDPIIQDGATDKLAQRDALVNEPDRPYEPDAPLEFIDPLPETVQPGGPLTPSQLDPRPPIGDGDHPKQSDFVSLVDGFGYLVDLLKSKGVISEDEKHDIFTLANVQELTVTENLDATETDELEKSSDGK